ncbi:MAG TPA: methyltransferase domain-containing protein [Cyclobacteriaceae bacterium]|nr:methyltransferase domain-containing protein [Cyclobacteriaceae bacterium]
MAKIFTTEITSEKITSDNPIHQRLFKAYVVAKEYVKGNLLEVGCGEGRGIGLLLPLVDHYTAIDKMRDVLNDLKKRHPNVDFISMNIPPLHSLPDSSFQSVVTFQVIEHIQDDALFLREIHRVLKPGGTALITTPNRKMSLSRNPWHIREYSADELTNLASKIFDKVEMKGITGNAKVMRYYEENRRSVRRITRWDIFNLQYRLPAGVLRIPYEMLNRWNRNKLQTNDNSVVSTIHHEDYLVTDKADNALDLLLIATR